MRDGVVQEIRIHLDENSNIVTKIFIIIFTCQKVNN